MNSDYVKMWKHCGTYMKDFFVDVFILLSVCELWLFWVDFYKMFWDYFGTSSSSDVKVILDEIRKYVTQCRRGSDRSAI